MMAHLLHVLIVPVAIVLMHYYAVRPFSKSMQGHVDVITKSLPNEFGYMFFLYYLGNEEILEVGWAPITLLIFLTPITLVALLLKAYYWVQKKDEQALSAPPVTESANK
jgi:hypothetical protein